MYIISEDEIDMHRIKSYGQNKIVGEILAISFVFWPHLRVKMEGARGRAWRPARELIFFFGALHDQMQWENAESPLNFDILVFLNTPNIYQIFGLVLNFPPTINLYERKDCLPSTCI